MYNFVYKLRYVIIWLGICTILCTQSHCDISLFVYKVLHIILLFIIYYQRCCCKCAIECFSFVLCLGGIYNFFYMRLTMNRHMRNASKISTMWSDTRIIQLRMRYRQNTRKLRFLIKILVSLSPIPIFSSILCLFWSIISVIFSLILFATLCSCRCICGLRQLQRVWKPEELSKQFWI